MTEKQKPEAEEPAPFESPADQADLPESGEIVAADAEPEADTADTEAVAEPVPDVEAEPVPDPVAPTYAAPAAETRAPAWQPPTATWEPPAAGTDPDPAEDKPERAILGAFAGGLVLATILKRLGS